MESIGSGSEVTRNTISSFHKSTLFAWSSIRSLGEDDGVHSNLRIDNRMRERHFEFVSEYF